MNLKRKKIIDYDLLKKNLTLPKGSNTYVYPPLKYAIKGIKYYHDQIKPSIFTRRGSKFGEDNEDFRLGNQKIKRSDIHPGKEIAIRLEILAKMGFKGNSIELANRKSTTIKKQGVNSP